MENFLKHFNSVRPAGIVLMLLGLLVYGIAGRFFRNLPKEKQEKYTLLVKLGGVVVCMAGTLIAIL